MCALTLTMMLLHTVSKFRELGSSNSRVGELICERLVRHGQKTGVFSRIDSGHTGLIFAIFSSHKSVLDAHNQSGPCFPISQGRCHGTNFGRNSQNFIRQAGVQEWIGIGSSDSNIFHGTIVGTSCAILIKI